MGNSAIIVVLLVTIVSALSAIILLNFFYAYYMHKKYVNAYNELFQQKERNILNKKLLHNSSKMKCIK